MATSLGELAPLEGVKRWAFVERALRLRLASALPNGAINVSPAWFVVVDETAYVPLDPTLGDPGQSTTPDARHMEIIDAGGRVSAVIDEGDEISNVRAVQLEGTANQVDDPELVEQLLEARGGSAGSRSDGSHPRSRRAPSPADGTAPTRETASAFTADHPLFE